MGPAPPCRMFAGSGTKRFPRESRHVCTIPSRRGGASLVGSQRSPLESNDFAGKPEDPANRVERHPDDLEGRAEDDPQVEPEALFFADVIEVVSNLQADALQVGVGGESAGPGPGRSRPAGLRKRGGRLGMARSSCPGTNSGRSARAPTRLISQRSTLNNCGNSSMWVRAGPGRPA